MKKLMMLLALALCLMTAATAMADKTITIQVEDLTYGTLAEAQLTISENHGIWDQKPAAGSESTAYTYGASRVNQHVNMANDGKYSGYTKKWCVFTPPAGSTGSGYRVHIPYSEITGEWTNVIAYYGQYDSNYTENESVFKNWKSSAATVSGTTETLKLDIHAGTPVPIVIAWERKNAGGGYLPVGTYNPANPAADAAANMPTTGDNSNLLLMFALLATSCAALGAMKLRRREN